MESLETRAQAVEKCLEMLKRSIQVFQNKQYPELHRELRDSIIQRFEFSVDTLWKFLREYLEAKKGITFDIVSPKEAARNALQIGFLDTEQYELFLDMINDRNKTSHTYNETLAQEICGRIISSYYELMDSILKRAKI